MVNLVRYDAACRALADAVSIDEVKAFRDQSEAMRAYARQAKNKRLEAQAAEIRFRAERRIGELMAAQRDSSGLSAGGRPSEKTGSKTNPVSAAPTLEEVGIDKKLADRARKYAAISEEEFNGIVDDWRERVEAENARVSVDLLAAGKRAQAKTADTKAEPDGAPAPDPFGHRKLTYEALAETADGLKEALAEERAKRRTAEAKAEDLKAQIAVFESDHDMGAKLTRALDEIRKVNGRMKEIQVQLARETRRANAMQKARDDLQARLEAQIIPMDGAA